ncbi:MAG: pilus assembly protein PilP [Gammaproteobacteria bacterium]|nr:pilus assembly protein PilP [Gammaproteobacteria bacterium]
MNGRALISLSIGLLLAGCSSAHTGNLQQFVATADANARPVIQPVPVIKTPKPVAFSMQNRPDPFEPFAMRNPGPGPNPDHNLPKGPLQHYPLADLTMVGTLRAGNGLWAIVTTPDGATHQVTVGTYMGEHYGRVVRITPNSIHLVETVAGPTGWVQQAVKLGIK